MLRLCAVLAVAAALGSPAAAQPVRGVAAANADESISAPKGVKTGDPNRRVCKVLGATGSRLAKGRICKTAREWAETQVQHQEDVNRMQKLPLKSN